MDRSNLKTREPREMTKRRQRKPDELAQDTTHQRLVAWALYHENLRSGMDEKAAVNKALRKVPPRGTKGSDNRARELGQWKRHNLWPSTLKTVMMAG
jgi:hypothetical protein